MRPREERNDETMKRTADKAIQMSLNNGLDHAGENGDQSYDKERQGLTTDTNRKTGLDRKHQTATYVNIVVEIRLRVQYDGSNNSSTKRASYSSII